MVDFELFQFAAAPLSGGHWFVDYFQRLLTSQQYNVAEPFPNETCSVLRVTTIRHPCEWLVNVYQVMRAAPAGCVFHPILQPFLSISCDSADVFVSEYCRYIPGEISRLFLEYTSHADSVIRFEDLREASKDLAQALGVPVVKSMLPLPVDVSRHIVHPALRQRVMQYESDLVQTYDYW